MAVSDKISVDSFLKKTLPVFRPNDTQKLSNGLTAIENAFNVISTGILNVNKIQSAFERSQKIAAREIAAETKVINAPIGLQEESQFASIGPLQLLLDSAKKLNEALSRLDLTPAAPPSTQGIPGALQGGDVDIDVNRGQSKGFKAAISSLFKAPSSSIAKQLSTGVAQSLRPQVAQPRTSVASDITKTLTGIALGTAGGIGLAGLIKSFGGGGGAGVSDITPRGSTKGSFANIMELAAKAGDPHPAVTAAQWALESAYGTKMSGKNNPFGQKATANEPGTTVRTREVVGGRDQYIMAKFKDYNSLDEAIKDHVNKWTKRHTTADMTPVQAIQAIQSKGYATDPNYVNAVASVIASNNIDPNAPFKFTKQVADTEKGGVGRISSKFSLARAHPVTGVTRAHHGIDVAAAGGTPVYSAQSGTVVRAGVVSGYGNYVMIQHGEGDTTGYGHLSEFKVAEGQMVTKAQIIGNVGSTGVSTGNHLHFEFRKGGKLIDPEPLFQNNKWIVGGAGITQDIASVAAPKPEQRAKPTPPPPRRAPRVGMESFKAKFPGVAKALGFTGGDKFIPAQTRK